MSSKTPLNAKSKRPREESGLQTPRKAQFGVVKIKDDICGEVKNFMFKILTPDGYTLELKMRESRNVISIEGFIDSVRKEYNKRPRELQRKINWKYQDLHFTDANSKKISIQLDLSDYKCDSWHFLRLHDGSPEPDIYENMWDLTPDTELLKELPDDYTFETALADLIDNSLQAVWSNCHSNSRLISIELTEDRIGIFDSGPGMDGTDGNLVKWGKIGASLHRSAREKAIGGKPPYLVPFFGMFGYGGPVATMCLGRRAVVSSKTVKCKKVFTLHLEREALISASHLETCWRTKGGMRDPSPYEKKSSPHGSFTKVEIFEPKWKTVNTNQILCKLKDIYFPYIQCDESGRTITPVKFQVNGTDLAGVRGGEVAWTNLHSCNGPNFVVQLRLSIKEQCKGVSLEANARMEFVYFPIIGGKESITKIIDCLDNGGYGNGESFEKFSRVSIRRLGRLLPDARWTCLPFMEPKQKIGEKAKILKRCSSRVKCFIDTDAGFNPTQHKTDLVQHHPYTKALKKFGGREFENDKEVQLEISNDGKEVTLPHLEKLYFDWVADMHEKYDEEVDGGLDKATIIICSPMVSKKLRLSSLVLRVHREIQRKGILWTAGQNIKLLKGACAGAHKNHVYATLEYVVLEGLEGDSCGEACLVCRPLGLSDDRGCKITNDDMGDKTIDIGDSLAFPIRVIDSGKFVQVDDTEWENKLNAHRQKLPSAIELLCDTDCRELEIEGGMVAGAVKAGDAPPENIVAVIRPKAFNSKNSLKRLDQRCISNYNNGDMTLSVNFRSDGEMTRKHIFSLRVSPCGTKGLNGLYIFSLRSRPDLFQKSGYYTFSFSLVKFKDVGFEQEFQVQASATACCWKVVSDKQDVPTRIRVGITFDGPSIACSDKYGNIVKFTSIPKLKVKLSSHGIVLAHVSTVKRVLSTDKSSMMIKGIVVESDKLDNIRPNYEATMCISTVDDAFSVAFPCHVLPGTPHQITVLPHNLREQLTPGQVIEELALEVFDKYGNHAKEDERILLSVNGFSYEDRSGVLDDAVTCLKKVGSDGIVDLSNILKVSYGYGKDVCLSVSSNDKVIFKLDFRTETRKLQTASKVFKNCKAGSSLDNIVFEIVDSEGIVDESVNHDEKCGWSHTLRIESDAFDIDDSVQYTFRRGRCTIRSIPLPRMEGFFSFSAAHSRYPELNLDIEVHVENVSHGNQPDTASDKDSGHLFTSAHNSCGDFSYLPQTPSSKALQSSLDLFSPLTLTGNTLSTSGIFSPETPEENSMRARQFAKAARENAGSARQLSKTLEENSVCVHQSAIAPMENAVPARQFSKTLEENLGHARQSLKTPTGPASQSLKSRKMLKANLPSSQSPITSTIPASQSPKSHKMLKANLPASQSPKTLTKSPSSPKNSKVDAATAINSPSRDSSNMGKDLGASAITQKEELEDAVLNSYMKMSELDKRLKMLECTLDNLQYISSLQDHDSSSPYGKVFVQGKIRSKSQSAAAITCRLTEEPSSASRSQDIIGVVALLGAVETIELSRMLAQYLGDDLMRAVVCKNSAAAKFLEMEHGKSISGGYYTLCLEDISPINCERSSNPQRVLSLVLPTNPDGHPPKGFLGYAVNMISIEKSFSQWKTNAGHGLRETLFYRLFGKLQVYDKRSQMMSAQSCIEGGAISLDGGIMRGNGLFSSGQWEPEVIFPVCVAVAHDLEVLKLEQEIDSVKKLLDAMRTRHSEALDRYNKHSI